MNKNIKTNDLFNCVTPHILPLLNEEYPWQILPKIKDYIRHFISSGAFGFTEIAKDVFVGKNVNISPNAVIEPPAIIGDCCELRPGAYLRGNVITGSNCVIGNSSELKNCVLLNNVQVPHYNYVGDSILGNHAHMGAGSICSNLKSNNKNVVIHGDSEYETGLRKVGAFLADYADIGCGCVLNPGTIVGKNTSIYPLTSVRGVIPSNSIMKTIDKILKKND